MSESGRIKLHHSRLSINGLGEKGTQPLESTNGKRIAIVNGEVYNHKNIRQRYQLKNKSESDCAIFADIDPVRDKAILSEINGMFASCVVDLEKERIYLIRDNYGMKPLYYSEIGNGLIFSSTTTI